MESQPQNPEFRNNPENFHPCDNVMHWEQDGEVMGSIPLNIRAVNRKKKDIFALQGDSRPDKSKSRVFYAPSRRKMIFYYLEHPF